MPIANDAWQTTSVCNQSQKLSDFNIWFWFAYLRSCSNEHLQRLSYKWYIWGGGAFHFLLFVGHSCSQEHQHRLHCVDTRGHTQTHPQTHIDTHWPSLALSLSLSLAPSLCPPHLSSCCLQFKWTAQFNLIQVCSLGWYWGMGDFGCFVSKCAGGGRCLCLWFCFRGYARLSLCMNIYICMYVYMYIYRYICTYAYTYL